MSISKAIIIVKDPSLSSTLRLAPSQDKELEATKSTNASIISLKHPSYDQNVRFMFHDNKIFELSLVQHPDTVGNPHSWFVGNTVISDGSLYVSAPINPIFLALPYLEQACKKSSTDAGCYVSYSQVLSPASTQINGTIYISKALKQIENQFEKMFDTTYLSGTDSDMPSIQIRINDSKFVAWLQQRVASTALALAKNPSTSPFYFTTEEGKAHLVKQYFSHKNNRLNGSPIAQYNSNVSSLVLQALEMIGEWVSPRLLTLLLETYSFQDNYQTNTYHTVSIRELASSVATALGTTASVDKENKFSFDIDEDDTSASSQPSKKAKLSQPSPAKAKVTKAAPVAPAKNNLLAFLTKVKK